MPKFCPNCGANLPNPDVKFCNECGSQINSTPIPGDSKKPEEVHREEKSPAVAILCSFFIPGLGQVYNGDTEKGIAVFFGTLIGVFIFFIPGLLVWLFGLYDVYTTAKKNECRRNSLQADKNCSHDHIFHSGSYHNRCCRIFGFFICCGKYLFPVCGAFGQVNNFFPNVSFKGG